MASKVMSSRSTTPDQDRPRQSPTYSDANRVFGSMNIDDILRSIYPESDSLGLDSGGGMMEGNRNKTLEDVWKEIRGDIAAGAGTGVAAMTLEDFLAKAGAVNKEDVRFPPEETMPSPPACAFGMDSGIMNPGNGVTEGHFAPASCMQNGVVFGGFGAEFSNGMVSGGGGGRGKRRASLYEAPLDRLTQQKQRRMIKNRESAARSRQRKQAYTVELEALVTQLEAENAMLLKEEAELNRKRYKELMANLIPVVEQQRPARLLRRVHSMEW